MASNNFLFALPEFEVLHLATPTLVAADSSYPATLVADFSNGDVSAKPSLSTGTDEAWLWDFTSAKRVDGLWLWHNADAGIVLRVQMNATNSWGSPTVDATITAPAKHKLGFTRKLFFDLTQAAGYSTGGFRYLRIRVPTNSVAPGIKAQAFSHFTRLERNVLNDVNGPLMQRAITLQTDFGHEWVYKLQAAQEAFQFQTRGSVNDQAALQAWFEACGRGIACCVVSTDTTYNSISQGIIGRLTSTASAITQPEAAGMNIQLFEQRRQSGSSTRTLIDFGIRELSAGLPEWT